MSNSDWIDALAQRLRYFIYQHFVETGQAPTLAEMIKKFERREAEITDTLRLLEEKHALALAPGSTNIWMAHPFSAIPTNYPVEADGVTYWANCAWDALAIPAMLGVDSKTQTFCPDCSSEIGFKIRANRLTVSSGVVHFAVPPRHFWDNVGFT